MKNIVVPTDFSPNANNALQYAINIANHFDSTIHLVHAFEVISSTGTLVSVRKYLLDDAKGGLEKTKQAVENSLFHHTTLTIKALEGSTIEMIGAYAKRVDADLIVMGTQGASGLKEVFLGSNASGVVQRSTIPVLVVPSGHSYRPFKRIVLAVDEEVVADDSPLIPLKNLAKEYKSRIEILHVDRSNPMEAIDCGIGETLGRIPHQTYSVRHNNVNEGINYFIDEVGADLLCMLRRERSFWERLFHRSAIRKETFSSPVPLLVLPIPD